MKRFLSSSTYFIIPFIMGLILSISLNSIIIRDFVLNIPENKSMLILGNSTTESCINDSIIKNAINLSESASSNFYSYLKLKHILNDNNNVKIVLLSFSPTSVFSKIEKSWLLNNRNISARLKYYYPIMDKSDLSVLTDNNINGVIQAFPSIVSGSIKTIIQHILGKTNNLLGRYKYLERDKLDMALSELQKEKAPKDFAIAKIEMKYIEKIIEECEKHNVELLFINTPKRKELWESKNYGAKQFYSYYDKYFSHITFLDLHDFDIPDYGYGDLQHLNYKGAKIFSEYIEKQGIERIKILHGLNK